MAALLCPLLAKTCIEHRCKFYLHAEWQSTTGETRSGFECLFILDVQFARVQVAEQIRTQAGVDKLATTIHENRAAAQALVGRVHERVMALQARPSE